MQSWKMFVAGSLTLGLTACAQPSTSERQGASVPKPRISHVVGSTGGPQLQPREPDWKDPLGPQGIDIGSSQEAELAFEASDPPSSIGDVQRISTHDPKQFDISSRHVIWVLKDAKGLFALDEFATDTSQGQLEKLGTCQPEETGCNTDGWLLVDVGGSAPALLIDAMQTTSPSVATSITWINNGVEFLLMGPVSTFSAADAVTYATEMVGP